MKLVDSATICGEDLSRTAAIDRRLTHINVQNSDMSRGCYSHSTFKKSLFHSVNLSGSDMFACHLTHMNMHDVDLAYASLLGADICNTYICSSVLRKANLSSAKMNDVYMLNSDCNGVVFDNAEMVDVILDGSDFTGAQFSGAKLKIRSMHGALGNDREIKNIRTSIYDVAYTEDLLQIGCELHRIDEWEAFDHDRIYEMDKDRAVGYWSEYRDKILGEIRKSPATPL